MVLDHHIRQFPTRTYLHIPENYYYYFYDSEDVWMPSGSLSSQPGVSNETQAALRLTTL